MKPVDFTGCVFGRLTVLGEAANRHANGKRQWVCRCVCENTITTIGHNLQSKDTRSCGCLKLDLHSKPYGVASRNRVKKTYRANARNRGLVWAISDTVFEMLLSGVCFYCGAAPVMLP